MERELAGDAAGAADSVVGQTQAGELLAHTEGGGGLVGDDLETKRARGSGSQRGDRRGGALGLLRARTSRTTGATREARSGGEIGRWTAAGPSRTAWPTCARSLGWERERCHHRAAGRCARACGGTARS